MPHDHHYFVYLLTNWNNKVMYIGMTNDLVRRVYEHKTKAVKGFTEKYNVHKLVYFEATPDVHSAIAREKEIKKWRREKKNALVLQANPEWRDLGNDLGLSRSSPGHTDPHPHCHTDPHPPGHTDPHPHCHSDPHPHCHSDRREES